MTFNRPSLPTRHAAFTVALSVLAIGMLHAQTGPGSKKQWVPVDNDPPIVIDHKHTPPGSKKPVPAVKKPAAPVVKELTGEQIYEQRCASCNGAKGEGGKG